MGASTIKRWLTHIFLVSLIGLVVLFLAEGIFLVISYTKTRSFTKQRLIEERQRALSEFSPGIYRATPTEGRFENFLSLHPFFGYVWKNPAADINNFGFRSPYQIGIDGDGYYIEPRSASDSYYVVGIFGGSFAEQMGLESGYLEELLAAQMPGKKPIVINFGFGGYAMPQQAYVFYYFRDLCDVAVFVDGVNEVWNVIENNRAGVPLEFAKAYHWRYLLSLDELTPERLQYINAIHRSKTVLHRFTLFSLLPVLRNSSFLHYSWKRFYNFFTERIRRYSWKMALSYEAGEKFTRLDDLQLTQFAASRWRSWHQSVHDIAAGAEVVDIHILQPNPFVSESKSLTEQEKASILSSHNIRESVERGYPLLKDSLEELKQQGLHCVDLTAVFRNQKETLWVDACHVNSQGYRIVLDMLAKEIIARAEEL